MPKQKWNNQKFLMNSFSCLHSNFLSNIPKNRHWIIWITRLSLSHWFTSNTHFHRLRVTEKVKKKTKNIHEYAKNFNQVGFKNFNYAYGLWKLSQSFYVTNKLFGMYWLGFLEVEQFCIHFPMMWKLEWCTPIQKCTHKMT